VGLGDVPPDTVRGESDRSIGLPEHFGLVIGTRVTPPILTINVVHLGASGQSIGVGGVNLEHALEQGSRLIGAEQVGHILVEPVGPQMRSGFGVDELRVDAHPVLIALHRAFQHVADAKLLADLLGVDISALVGKGGAAGDNEAVADA
jgi:hypothetical protein